MTPPAYLYLDHNLLGHLDNEIVVETLQSLQQRGVFSVISHHHLTEICRSESPEKHIPRLAALKPLFLSVEKAKALQSAGSVDLTPIIAADEVRWHLSNMRALEQELLTTLTALLKFAGGLSTADKATIVEDYVRSLRSTVDILLSELGPISRRLLRFLFGIKLWKAERQIRKSFNSIDFEKEASNFTEIRRKVTSSGNISQVPADSVVSAVLSHFDDQERRAFQEYFPPNFALNSTDRAHSTAGFAFALFSIGAITKTGKAFSGNADRQKKLFRAQYLDCLHIGEASSFNAFATCDAGAARLAKVVYGYAGISTEVIFIRILQDN